MSRYSFEAIKEELKDDPNITGVRALGGLLVLGVASGVYRLAYRNFTAAVESTTQVGGASIMDGNVIKIADTLSASGRIGMAVILASAGTALSIGGAKNLATIFIEPLAVSTKHEGLSAMNRPNGPMPTPRVDFDVNTGLPNHRATDTTPTHATALPGWVDPTASEAGINISERLAFENIGELKVSRSVIWKDV